MADVVARLTAALAGRYRIEREIGQGGMATVYLAEDLKHKRQVALKLLRPELAAALGAERFLREITTTANLRHPHILPLYDSGEADDFLYYVMPFVEGESLRSRLDRETQLPIDDATRIAAEVADALSYAHSRGVIHRDIKPENILLENGHAVVADFGIAQAVTESGGEKLTRTGMALGTPLYMSPEQWSGEPVDARSDLYALACVVYEMLAGSPPFSGPTAQVLMARHAIDPVPALRTARSTVTQAVADTIERALAKVPSDRFPSVQAWREALLRPAAPAAVPAPESSATTAPSDSAETRAAEGFWVAVLPFKCAAGNADLAALSEGLSEGIVTGLSRFSYLKVIAHSSTLRFGSAAADVRAVGKELGARYVLEGSLRQAGARLRVAVQVIDAATGAHLWAENYDRAFDASEIFALQDDLVPRVVSTTADMHGVLLRSMSEALRHRDPDTLSADEAVLRAFGFFARVTAEEHAEVRRILERAVERAPNHADCWAMLARMYTAEHMHDFNPRPDSLGRALEAARRAVAAAPSHQLTHYAQAEAHFFRREIAAFRNASERAIALNAMDGDTLAFMGILIAYTGDWDHGCALAEQAMQLNPHHPGWYRFCLFVNAYRKRDYRAAVDIALKMNMPSYFATHAALAGAYGQLGERDAAAVALRELLAQKPDFNPRELWGRWIGPGELLDHVVDGLRKAGLAVEPASVPGTPAPTVVPTMMPQKSDKHAIVVLPFVNRSPDADNEYFSDGLTEEISTDLAGIKSLRVISRTSALRFKGTDKDIPTIGRELGVRYVLEGSVRKAGASLRITARLVDAETDGQLWAEKYAGGMEDVFAIQEEISRKIVSALRIELTDAESRAVAQRPIDNPAAYDCYLRAQYEMYVFTPDALDRAQKLVDDGLAIIGENALLLATKGLVAWAYVNFSIRVEERYLDEAAACAVKALAQDPQGYLGIFLRGLVAARRGDIESALRDIQRAYELKPGDAAVGRELTRLLLSAGQEQGKAAGLVFEEVLRVDPLGPLSWGVMAGRHFVAGRMVEAQAAARRAVELTERGNPARAVATWWLAVVNLRDEAVAVFDELGTAALPGMWYGSVSLFLGRALRGDADGAVGHVTPQLEQTAYGNEYLALQLADGYALIGHNEAALRWLRVAVERGFINFPFLANHDPFLEPLHGDAGFEDLMQQVQRRWQASG